MLWCDEDTLDEMTLHKYAEDGSSGLVFLSDEMGE